MSKENLKNIYYKYFHNNFKNLFDFSRFFHIIWRKIIMNKTIFILSGPAGVGKTTIWHKIEHRVPHIAKIITTTSRDIRPGETNGVDYHFLSRTDFEAKIAA